VVAKVGDGLALGDSVGSGEADEVGVSAWVGTAVGGINVAQASARSAGTMRSNAFLILTPSLS